MKKVTVLLALILTVSLSSCETVKKICIPPGSCPAYKVKKSYKPRFKPTFLQDTGKGRESLVEFGKK